MNKKDFISNIEKLATSDLIRVASKGEHVKHSLGINCIGSTYTQNEHIWRKYGTLENIIIFKTSDEANKILKNLGISELIAKPTKSKPMCRLYIK